DVRDLELGRVCAGGLDGKIARAEAEQPVAKDVVRVLLDPNPERVVSRLSSRDHRADPDLASTEDRGRPAVVQQEYQGPDYEDEQRDGHVAEGVDVDVDQA